MEIAFGANLLVALQFGAINDCVAGIAFRPQAFGYVFLSFSPEVRILEGNNFSNQFMLAPAGPQIAWNRNYAIV